MKPAVWPLTGDDCAWAAEVMERRRQIYAVYSPVFWRPAGGIVDVHGRFLATRLASEGAVGLRTHRGFLIGEPKNQEGLVDDFAVEPDSSWASDGAELLCAAWAELAAQGLRTLRVVTAAADQEKVAMLRSCSLQLAEQWWVKPLEPTGTTTGLGTTGRITGSGFSGTLGPAPPVYDPGGPVLFVDRLYDGADLADLVREATATGAVLAVVPTPASAEGEDALRRHGWAVASAWYTGIPRHGRPGPAL